MRIGIHSFIESTNLEGAIQQVIKAEEEGFDSFWFGQTLGADVMTAIALAGQRTERIEIGVAVVPTYSRHPFAMAQQALTVQAATGGRFPLGLGPPPGAPPPGRRGPRRGEPPTVPRLPAAAEAAGRPGPRVCVALPIAVTA